MASERPNARTTDESEVEGWQIKAQKSAMGKKECHPIVLKYDSLQI